MKNTMKDLAHALNSVAIAGNDVIRLLNKLTVNDDGTITVGGVTYAPVSETKALSDYSTDDLIEELEDRGAMNLSHFTDQDLAEELFARCDLHDALGYVDVDGSDLLYEAREVMCDEEILGEMDCDLSTYMELTDTSTADLFEMAIELTDVFDYFSGDAIMRGLLHTGYFERNAQRFTEALLDTVG